MSVLYLVIVCNVCFFQSVIGQNLPRSPCPDVFHYEQHNDPGYFPVKGVIHFRSQLPINLTVEIVIPALLRSTYGGKFELAGSKKDFKRKLVTETEPTFRFILLYPNNLPVPLIKFIKLNGLHLCASTSPQAMGTVVTYTYTVKQVPARPTGEGDRKGVFYQWTFHADIKPYNGPPHHGQPLPSDPGPKYQPPDVNYPPTENPTRLQADDNPIQVILEGTSDGLHGRDTSLRPGSGPSNLDEACGKSISVIPLIVGGLSAGRGQWPWLVALYKSKGTGLEFTCGATLISNQLLVTAAHCVAYNVTSTRRGMKAYIGKYDLSNWDEPDSHLMDISDIYVHPDYQSYPLFHSDIAVLKLRRSVTMSLYVAPACLSFEDDYQSLNNDDSKGIVVGWGRVTPEGSISPVPQMITLPIVSKEECFESSMDLRFLATNTTFCAGKRNGRGPCSGDSGTGLLTSKKDRNGKTRWFLRGIVSVSLQTLSNTSSICDLSNYIVFTDVLKFKDWLSRFLSGRL